MIPPPLSIHRSVAVHCPVCRQETNVIVDGQCVACHVGRKEPAVARKAKPRKGQH